MRVFLLLALSLSVLSVVSFFILSSAETHSHGVRKEDQRFEVYQGENVVDLSARLESSGLIISRIPFLWHIARIGKTHALVAGIYRLNGDLTITEITHIITTGDAISRDIKVTFPEGWNSKKMSARLIEKNLPGDEFLSLVQKPNVFWKTQFDFLSDAPSSYSLEGFLFPDTYFFDPSDSAEMIIEKMLTNFDKKFDATLRAKSLEQKRSIYEVVTLASIVENEVKSFEERMIVADIFLRRISIGQALQSDATIQYILGIDKVKHSFEETRTDSPYNTYINPGLPPGPIGNPGLDSLRATVTPKKNSYLYFLNDAKTGETIFAVTFEEHIKNKSLHGL